MLAGWLPYTGAATAVIGATLKGQGQQQNPNNFGGDLSDRIVDSESGEIYAGDGPGGYALTLRQAEAILERGRS